MVIQGSSQDNLRHREWLRGQNLCDDNNCDDNGSDEHN